MARKVQSTTVSLWDVLNTSTPYMIPYNQRPYTWDLKNWEGLWNSFFSENDKSTFLGSFIFLTDEDPEKDIQIFDGQQRITTLTILCKSFIDVLFENGFIKEATKIHAFAMKDFDDKPKLKVSRNLNEYFSQSIQCSIESPAIPGKSNIEQSIFKAYSYFSNEVKELLSANENNGAKIYENFKNRLSNLEVVKLTISDVILGIEIFESVNATGKKLNASELAKNVLIKHGEISKTHDIESIDQIWTEINNRLLITGFTFIDFIHYYWISKYKAVGKSQLFGEMKKKFNSDSEKWLVFFSELEQASKTFENIFSCYDFASFSLNYPNALSNPKYSEKYLRYLQCLSHIKNKSWIIPIFTLLDYETKINKLGQTFIGNKKFHEILKKHFVFSFLHFNIYSLATRDYTPAMYKLSKAINVAHDKYPQDPKKSNELVSNAFQDYFNGNDSYIKKTVGYFKAMPLEFNEGIHKLNHTNSNKFLIHNLFGEIEESVFGGTFHNIAKTSIEHYMPQESAKSWGIPKEISRIHENRLGNILIIDADLNGKLQNKAHVDKMNLLRGHASNSNFTNEFVQVNDLPNGDFNFGMITTEHLSSSDPIEMPSEIDKRTKLIGSYLKKIYLTDFNY
jgi:uncharacterized protein with ParB-like and HNH nuclease domain